MKNHEVSMKQIFNILGRGTIVYLHDRYPSEFNIGDTLNGEFLIRGIEGVKTLMSNPAEKKGVGLVYRKIHEREIINQ